MPETTDLSLEVGGKRPCTGPERGRIRSELRAGPKVGATEGLSPTIWLVAACACWCAIRTADPETVRRRFLGTPPRLTPSVLTRLTTVDYRQRFTLVAIDPVTAARASG